MGQPRVVHAARMVMLLQVNTLSNIRKARLGRLDPVFRNKVKIQTRTYDIMPPELVAEHEAKSRVSIAKRLTGQGECYSCSFWVSVSDAFVQQ